MTGQLFVHQFGTICQLKKKYQIETLLNMLQPEINLSPIHLFVDFWKRGILNIYHTSKRTTLTLLVKFLINLYIKLQILKNIY